MYNGKLYAMCTAVEGERPVIRNRMKSPASVYPSPKNPDHEGD